MSKGRCILLFVLLLTWSDASGQDVVPNRRRDFQLSSASSGPDLSNVAYRWVASDLATNAAISGNWTDEIQGASWVQGASANQPTNSASGVWLDSSHFFTNAGLTLGTSNLAFGFIWNMVDPGGGSSLLPAFLSAGSALSCADPDTEMGFQGSGYALYYSSPCAGSAFTGSKFGSLTNVFSDFLMSQVLSNTSPSMTMWSYTNGALCVSNDSVHNSLNYYYGFSAPPERYPQRLGRGNSGNGPSLRLRELWIWTNGTGNVPPLSSTRIANFHAWRTNHYGP